MLNWIRNILHNLLCWFYQPLGENMTLTNPSNRADFVGNGGTATYPFTFRVDTTDTLTVIQTDTSGAQTYPVYTVTGLGLDAGGSITLTAGNLTNLYKLAIIRTVPITQETDISNQGVFFSSVHEATFDQLVKIDQQQQDQINRAIKMPVGQTGDGQLPGAQDGYVLGWADGVLVNASEASAQLSLDLQSTATGKGGDLVATNNNYASDHTRTVNDKTITQRDAHDALTAAKRADVRADAKALDVSGDLSAFFADQGGVKLLPKGTYKILSGIGYDNSAPAFPTPLSPNTRVDLLGESMESTRIAYNGAANSYAITQHGDINGVSQGCADFVETGNFSLFDLGYTATRRGIYCKGRNGFVYKNMNIGGFDWGFLLESSLSSWFHNVRCDYNNTGMIIRRGSGNSECNAITFESCSFSGNAISGIVGSSMGATVRFSNCRFEGNGTTSGASGQGGFGANFTPDNGTACVIFENCYFEANKGESDCTILNTSGGYDITAVFIGCVFNRSSSFYTTTNIQLLGRVRAVGIGCGFLSAGLYTPSAARPYIFCDANATFQDIGCTYSENTSQAHYHLKEGVLSGRIAANGTMVNSSPGVVTSGHTPGSGIYGISSTLPQGFGKTVNDYLVMAVPCAPSTGKRVDYVNNIDPGGCTVICTNLAGVATDCDFNFYIHRLR